MELLNSINLNAMMIEGYSDFIENRIPEIMARKIIIDNRLMIDLSSYRLEDSITVSSQYAKQEKDSREVLLKALAKITLFTKDEKGKDKALSVDVDTSICRIPKIDRDGSFTINGVDRVLVSHLGIANVFLRDNDDNVRVVKWKNLYGAFLNIKYENGQHSIKISQGSTPKSLRTTKGGNAATLSIKSILDKFGYTDRYEEVVGVNPQLLYSLNNTNDREEGNIDSLLQIKLTGSERRQINTALSFQKRIVGKTLSEDVIDSEGNKLASKGDIITMRMANLFNSKRISKIYIDSIVGEYIVLNNAFVDIADLLKDNILKESDINEKFIDKAFDINEKEIDIDDLKNSIIHGKYKKINYNVLSEIIEDCKKDDTLSIRNQMNLRYNELVGTSFTREDILASINLYSLYLADVDAPDDKDSLNHKKLLGVSDLFSILLLTKLHGHKVYNVGRALADKYSEKLSQINMKGTKDLEKNFVEIFGEDIFKNDVSSFADAMIVKGMEKLFQVESNISPQEEISMKRKITQQFVEGIGGISGESQSASPRGIKASHTCRICCVETTEGGAVGLVLHLASLAKVDRDGYIYAPFFKVDHKRKKIDTSKVYYLLPFEEEEYTRSIGAKISDTDESEIVYLKNSIEVESEKIFPVFTYVGDTIELINGEEFRKKAESTLKVLKKEGKADSYKIKVRRKNWFEDEILDGFSGVGKFVKAHNSEIELVAVAPFQLTSVTSGTIPFSPYSDGVRQLMGSQMKKQAEPIKGSEKCVLRSNTLDYVARFTGGVKKAPVTGYIIKCDSKEIVIRDTETGQDVSILIGNIDVTSEEALINYKSLVNIGDPVIKGDIIAEAISVEDGEVKYGVNLTIAYGIYDGYNYEDGICINERLFTDDILTSYRSKTYTMTVDLNEGELEINDASASKKILNKNNKIDKTTSYYKSGMIQEGEDIETGSILAIKLVESSKKPGHYIEQVIEYDEDSPGKVVNCSRHVIRKDNVIIYEVVVSTEERIQLGDKMAGRYGNKGVIGRIIPESRMHYTHDGKIIDVLLTPLGVPSRMNLGQVIEVPIAGIAEELNFRLQCRTGETVDLPKLKKLIQDYYGDGGKVELINADTGRPFANKFSIGTITMGKLKHLSSHKLVSRGTNEGGYTSYGQPPSGKRNKGGQKYGEMEMDSYIAYGAENVLKELFSSSDDKANRNIKMNKNNKAYNDLVEANNVSRYKGEQIISNTSESFRQAYKLMESVGLNYEMYNSNGRRISIDNNRIEQTGSIDNMYAKGMTEEELKNEKERLYREYLRQRKERNTVINRDSLLDDDLSKDLVFDNNIGNIFSILDSNEDTTQDTDTLNTISTQDQQSTEDMEDEIPVAKELEAPENDFADEKNDNVRRFLVNSQNNTQDTPDNTDNQDAQNAQDASEYSLESELDRIEEDKDEEENFEDEDFDDLL